MTEPIEDESSTSYLRNLLTRTPKNAKVSFVRTVDISKLNRTKRKVVK